MLYLIWAFYIRYYPVISQELIYLGVNRSADALPRARFGLISPVYMPNCHFVAYSGPGQTQGKEKDESWAPKWPKPQNGFRPEIDK